MKIPTDAVIGPDKLTRYLLTPRPWDDKSRFLGQAGFRLEDPAALERAIGKLASETEAEEDGENEYGTFLRIEGQIAGPNGRSLPAVVIWLRRKSDGRVHLVTLKPGRG